MFMFFFLRFKYGPPIIVLAGVALIAIGAGVTHHLATGITGAVLVVIGATAGVTRRRRSIQVGDPDEAPREMSRSTDSAGHPTAVSMPRPIRRVAGLTSRTGPARREER